MSLSDLKSRLPEYAKDVKLNLASVLSEEGAPGLSQKQILGTALASAYASGQPALISDLTLEAAEVLAEEDLRAAKAAATMMAMNNVYYRFVHLADDADYGTMRAGLRMNIIGTPGVPKADFELYSLAVSAINACEMCIQAHIKQVVDAGLTKQAVQSCVRIAAVVMSAAQALAIEASA